MGIKRGARGTRALWLAVATVLGADAVVVGIELAEPAPAAAAADDLVAFAAHPSRVLPVVALLPEPPPPPPVQAAGPAAPVEPPADEHAPEPAVVLGSIEIPKLGLSVPLNQGISLSSIDRGPSHWPGTAMPGQVGNVVIAGHRVTKTRPFRNIDQLAPGDEIIFTIDGVRSVYAVNGDEVVTPDAMRIVDPTPTPTATLFACHPPGSARYRYVVTADLVRTEAA